MMRRGPEYSRRFHMTIVGHAQAFTVDQCEVFDACGPHPVYWVPDHPALSPGSSPGSPVAVRDTQHRVPGCDDPGDGAVASMPMNAAVTDLRFGPTSRSG
jgi:hypothetical protein